MTLSIPESTRADIVFAVHLSDRMKTGEMLAIEEFLRNLVNQADLASGNVQIGLLIYGADPQVVFHINR